jgi:hypothetical protein
MGDHIGQVGSCSLQVQVALWNYSRYPSHNSRIWLQEVFAPVVILEPFDTLDEAAPLRSGPRRFRHG